MNCNATNDTHGWPHERKARETLVESHSIVRIPSLIKALESLKY